MRIFLILIGFGFFLIALFLGVVFFSTSLHRTAFLWALDGKVENVSVKTVRMSPSSFYLEDFNIVHEGTSVSTDQIEVKASWLAITQSRKVLLEEVTIKGLEADLAAIVTAGGGGLGAWLGLLGKNKAPSDEPWIGILAEMVPVDQISIRKLRLDGQIRLSDQQTIDLNVSLDNLTVGEQARMVLQGTFLDDGEASLVEKAFYELSVDLDQSETTINNLAIQLELQALGSNLNSAGEVKISGLWNLSRTATGEVLSLLIRDNQQPEPLIDTELDLNVETGELQGRLTAKLNGSLLNLPAFLSIGTLSANGQVEWNFKTGIGSFGLGGSGVMEGRSLRYEFDGSGKAFETPTLIGCLKIGFSDFAGIGECTVNLDFNSGNRGQVRAPLEVKRGNRVSQLVLETDVNSLKLNAFELLLRGETVYLEDLQLVGKALAAWGYSIQHLDTVSVQGHLQDLDPSNSATPWKGIVGTADVEIQRLVLSQGIAMEPLSVSVSVRPNNVSLTSFSSRLAAGSIMGKGDLIYSSNNPRLYKFRAEGSVANLPSDLVDLGSGAPITGSWTGSVRALGQAENLEQLSEAVQISMDLEGTSGLLQFNKINKSTNQSSQVASLGVALFGVLLKDERLLAVSNMTRYLQRVPYDSIRLNVDRLSQGKVIIHDFSVIGPELLLSGKGSVDATSWASLTEGALAIRLSMGSKGAFGENAKILGLVGTDLNGEYELWRKPINVSGTVSNPNYSGLRKLIYDALR